MSTESTGSSSEKAEPVKMQVLCLGLCRTGTQTLACALSILGYGPAYHMKEVHQQGHAEFWIQAFESKFGNGDTVLDKQFWDSFLDGWASITDVPAAFFASELMDAYPDAHLILSTRSSASWLKSMQSTLWAKEPTSGIMKLSDQFVWKEERENGGTTVFERHNEEVLRLAQERGREVLVLNLGEGWDKLCEFLGKVIPKGEDGEPLPFPRSDDWATMGWKVDLPKKVE